MYTALLLTGALLVLGSAFVPAAAQSEGEQQQQAEARLVSDVAAWIAAAGGSVDVARQNVRRERRGPRAYGPRGVFATEAIAKGGVLASVPWELIVAGSSGSGGSDDSGDNGGEAEKLCPTARALAKELAKGDDEMSPLAKLLSDPSSDASVPETWSEAGRKLLDEVLGESGAIGPLEYGGRYRDLCKGGDEAADDDAAVADRALFLAVTRSKAVSRAVDDDATTETLRAVIPFVDLYNHKNGRYPNVAVVVADGGKAIQAVSTRNIRKGDQLYVSYGTVDTALVLRDYGFVEFPQRWRFDFGEGHVVEFDLDAGRDGDLRPAWIERPDSKTVELMEKEMNRLQKVEADLYTASRKQTKTGEMSKEELSTIWKYHGALINAMDHSIIEARGRKANLEL